MIDLFDHIKSHTKIKLSNGLVYRIGEYVEDDDDQYFVCSRTGCKSKHVQSSWLARFSEEDEIKEKLYIRGQLVLFIK